MLSPAEFTVLMKWWCGMDVFGAAFACVGCGAAVDRAGYHALTCRAMGSYGVRHNALREIYLHFLIQADIPAEREAPSLLPGTAARPADILYATLRQASLLVSTSPLLTPRNRTD